MKLSVLTLSTRLSAAIPLMRILVVACDNDVGIVAAVIVARVGRYVEAVVVPVGSCDDRQTKVHIYAIEKVVAPHLTKYLQKNDLLPRLQSAYRRHHSTETALLRVLSEIYAAADRQDVTLLGLLDLSAAFDCVDHDSSRSAYVVQHFRG